MKTNPPPGYVDLKEATEMSGDIDRRTILRAVETGQLFGIQRGRKSPWYFRPADIRNWLGIADDHQKVSF